jgi:hypothetical protein
MVHCTLLKTGKLLGYCTLLENKKAAVEKQENFCVEDF